MKTFLPLFALAVLFLAFAQWGDASKSLQISEENYGTIQKIEFRFTASATGEIVAASPTANAYSGKILQFAVVSDASDVVDATLQIFIYDQSGLDVLKGAGANLNLSTPSYAVNVRESGGFQQIINDATLGVVANDKLIFSATRVGDTRKATATLFIR